MYHVPKSTKEELTRSLGGINEEARLCWDLKEDKPVGKEGEAFPTRGRAFTEARDTGALTPGNCWYIRLECRVHPPPLTGWFSNLAMSPTYPKSLSASLALSLEHMLSFAPGLSPPLPPFPFLHHSSLNLQKQRTNIRLPKLSSASFHRKPDSNPHLLTGE